jgi:hypothetical protein
MGRVRWQPQVQREATVLLPLLLPVGSEEEEYQLLQKAEDREEKIAFKPCINVGLLKSGFKKPHGTRSGADEVAERRGGLAIDCSNLK